MTNLPDKICRAAHYISRLGAFGALVYIHAYVTPLNLIVWVTFGMVIGSPPIETIKALILWKKGK